MLGTGFGVDRLTIFWSRQCALKGVYRDKARSRVFKRRSLRTSRSRVCAVQLATKLSSRLAKS